MPMSVAVIEFIPAQLYKLCTLHLNHSISMSVTLVKCYILRPKNNLTAFMQITVIPSASGCYQTPHNSVCEPQASNEKKHHAPTRLLSKKLKGLVAFSLDS